MLGPQISGDVCVYFGQCLSVCAGPCLRGWLSVARRPQVGVGVPQHMPVSTCVCPCPRGRLSVTECRRASVGVCSPAGAEVFSLSAGGAPRAEPKARRSGAEPARGPKPQADPRRGPPPTPPPALARASCGAPEPELSRGAETAAAPVGCRDRAPGAAETALSAVSPALSGVRTDPPPIPGPRPGDQQVSDLPGPSPFRLPPPNFPPRGSQPPAPALFLLCPGSVWQLSPPSLPPRVGRGEEGAQLCLTGGDPPEEGVSDRRAPPPLPFPSGFPCALSRAGGGGAAAPVSPPTPPHARGKSEIGARIPEAGDPKVRAATRRAMSVAPESGELNEQGWGWGRGQAPLFCGWCGAVLPGCPPWDELSAHPDQRRISVRPDGGEISVCVLSLRTLTTKRSLCLLTP